jgi:hypothetical protein
MNSSMNIIAPLMAVLLAVFCLPGFAQQAAPRLFFTDLESGPANGGENNQGAFITIYALNGEDYIEPSSNQDLIRGSNNLFFGSGPPPIFLALNITGDPLFTSLLARDFTLQSASPAVDAGTDTGIHRDHNGVSRPQGPSYDIGAYEYSRSSLPRFFLYLPCIINPLQ